MTPLNAGLSEVREEPACLDPLSLYEELLVQRDFLQREVHRIYSNYLRLFGNLLERRMELQMECIARKNAITWLAARRARRQPARKEQLREYLFQKTAAYNNGLQNFRQSRELAEAAPAVSEEEQREIKKIYRQIARQIHPDLHPDLWQIPGIKELWLETGVACETGSLQEIQDLQIRIQKTLRDAGRPAQEIHIPDLERRLEALQKEIRDIETTEPYILKVHLESEEAIQAHRQQLEEECRRLEAYKYELEQALYREFALEWSCLWPAN